VFEPGMPGHLPDTAFLHTKVDVVRDSIECQKSMKDQRSFPAASLKHEYIDSQHSVDRSTQPRHRFGAILNRPRFGSCRADAERHDLLKACQRRKTGEQGNRDNPKSHASLQDSLTWVHDDRSRSETRNTSSLGDGCRGHRCRFSALVRYQEWSMLRAVPESVDKMRSA
jgi:hypothetical protein